LLLAVFSLPKKLWHGAWPAERRSASIPTPTMNNPKSRKKGVAPGVFYITHRDNLPSIFQHGVLSYERASSLSPAKVYDEEIVVRRGDKKTPDGTSLWHFANFYFQPRNPMLYRVFRCERQDVVVLHLHSALIEKARYVSIGNAASSASRFMGVEEGIAKIQSDHMRKILHAGSWGDGEQKRLIMSELLVPNEVSHEYIDTVYVPGEGLVRETSEQLSHKAHVAPEPNLFFENSKTSRLKGTKISVVDGDMFFSNMQTLTISVNTVGVMGAGLASRAKENFPQVYVAYQQLCRDGRLTTKSPHLYKEEYSYDAHMADDPDTLTKKPNDERWFLLFATKEHWRNPSRLEYLEGGLQWLLENAGKEGIKSLAMPALGCGLGGLPWHRVGPVMCRYLRELDIDCEIYLPRETAKRVPDAQLSEKFLLSD